jgi:GT2 family glycosyltransferase
MPIPKIIHQIWIGPKPRPKKFMETFRAKHPDFEYICWTEEEMAKRGFKLENQVAYDRMTEWCGKADILRWELLYRYGGIYQDADSVCLEPFDDTFLSKTAFAAYENEIARQGLVAVGTMGFPPGYPLCRDAIDWIKTHDTCPQTCGLRAWATTGPVLLTNLLNTGKYPDFSVFPSHCFIPLHFTGVAYEGHKKVHCYQEWGSTKQSYETMDQIEVPIEYREPYEWVSVLVSSYNTKFVYIRECLESIRAQNGHFGIELVWMNDGSDELSSKLLESELEHFRKSTRFTRIIYNRSYVNMGLGPTLNQGLQLCTCDLVVKMDSDDIMVPDRIKKQLEFMREHPDCMMAGANLHMFRSELDNPKERVLLQSTNHPQEITLDWLRQTRSDWFMNHPTMIYRKSAVLEVGNYNPDIKKCSEDYDLELRMLKRYGRLLNMPDILLYYRIHEDQSTYNGKSVTPENQAARERMKAAIL